MYCILVYILETFCIGESYWLIDCWLLIILLICTNNTCVVCMDMYRTACSHYTMHPLFVSCSSVSSSSYNKMVNTLLPVTQASNSSLVVPRNASRYLDTPVDAVYLTVVSVEAQCQLSNATVHVSTLERDVGEGHCSILCIYGNANMYAVYGSHVCCGHCMIPACSRPLPGQNNISILVTSS